MNRPVIENTSALDRHHVDSKFGIVLFLALVVASFSISSPVMACDEGVWDPDSVIDPIYLIGAGGISFEIDETVANDAGGFISIECFMEEVIVTAQKIDNFYFVPSLMRGFYRAGSGGPNGTVEIPEPPADDRVFEVPGHDPYASIDCGSDPEYRRAYASIAWGTMFTHGSLQLKFEMGAMSDEPIRIEYPGGDVELWTVVAPTSPNLGLSASPITNTCIEN